MLVSVTILLAALIGGLILIPNAQASEGKWRSINPTQYTLAFPFGELNSIFMINGGTGGIGAGNGFAVGNNGIAFRWDGFSWRNQSSGVPCNLYSVNFGNPSQAPASAINPSVGMAVGGPGGTSGCTGQVAILWNGISWVDVTTAPLSSTAGNLTSIFMTSVTSSTITAMAVGKNATAGTSYFFHGTHSGVVNDVLTGLVPGWTQIPVPASTGCKINAVSMTSVNEGWAGGECGKFYHYFAGGWTNPYTFAGITWYSIYMDSPTDGWAVGSGGNIYHYTGGPGWNPVSTGATTNTLRGVTMVSSSEGWAVGDHATVLHGANLNSCYSSCWSALDSNMIPTLKGLIGIHATGSSNVWAVGETGSVIMFDGSVWGSITAPLQADFTAVWLTGSGDGLAVGRAVSPRANVVHWDGVKWVRVACGGPTDLSGVWESSSNDGWAVGGSGTTPYVYHFTGGSSCSNPSVGGSGALRSVFGTASNNVWAVGDLGNVVKWDGTSWSNPALDQPVPAGTNFHSVTFVGGDQNNGWAVGSTPAGALIYRYTSTDHWIQFPNPLSATAGRVLNSVAFLDSSHGYAVGNSGTVMAWDGVQWNLIALGSPGLNLTAVWPVSANDVWAVGEDTATQLPVFVNYDGNVWNTVPTTPAFPTKGRLQGLYLLSGTDGFAVGTSYGMTYLGLMFHLDPPTGGPINTLSTTNVVTTTSVVTSVATSTTSTSSVSSSASSATSISQATSSMSQASTSATSQAASSTSSSSATSMGTVTVTASSSQTTPLVVPAVPGFPLESIIAGVMIGLTVLVILRQRRRSETT
jgi:hypothetical protein